MTPITAVLIILVPLFFLLLALLILGQIATAIHLLREVRRLRAAPGLRLEDLSDRVIAAYEPLIPMVQALAHHGFRRVGEAGIGSADYPDFWYFASPDGATQAKVYLDGARPRATLVAWFGDEAVLVTSHPAYDVPLNDDDYRYHPRVTSLDESYQHHRAQIAEFEPLHGAPRPLDGMDEVLRREHLYNAQFAPRRVRPILKRMAVSVGLIVGAAAIILIMT